MTKHINGLKHCECGGYPRLDINKPNKYYKDVRRTIWYRFVCPKCGKESGLESTVKKAKDEWNNFFNK